jgi:hypothetical protein
MLFVRPFRCDQCDLRFFRLSFSANRGISAYNDRATTGWRTLKSIVLLPERMLQRPFYKHIAPALLVGLGLRLFFIWRFPFASGDTSFYEELARNWLDHGIYGLTSNGTCIHRTCVLPGSRDS